MKVELYDPQISSDKRVRSDATYVVNSYSHHAIGGPEQASVSVRGDERVLSELVRFLRGPIVITQLGTPVWWGYLFGAEIRIGSRQINVSMGEMFNRVACIYSELKPGQMSSQTKTITPWASDSKSIGHYGYREKLMTMSNAYPEVAEAARDLLLYNNKLPTRDVRSGMSEGGSMSALITAKGWWSTVSWQYFSQVTGSEQYVDTGTGVQHFGVTGNPIAQQFTPAADGAWSVELAAVRMRKFGTPGDTVRLDLCAESGGLPGAVLATGTIDAGVISDSNYVWNQATLSPRININYGTNYWLKVSRTGASDVNNYFAIDVNEELGYTRGVFRMYNGSNWVARAPDADMLFQVNCITQTSDQMPAMCTAAQFLTGYYIKQASGVYMNPYRNGETSIQYCLRDLFKAGTSNGRRYLCNISVDRKMTIYEEPQTVTLRVDKRDHWWASPQSRIDKWTCPVGQWFEMSDLPEPLATDYLTDPGKYFIERSTYYPDKDRLQTDPPGADTTDGES